MPVGEDGRHIEEFRVDIVPGGIDVVFRAVPLLLQHAEQSSCTPRLSLILVLVWLRLRLLHGRRPAVADLRADRRGALQVLRRAALHLHTIGDAVGSADRAI